MLPLGFLIPAGAAALSLSLAERAQSMVKNEEGHQSLFQKWFQPKLSNHEVARNVGRGLAQA